MESSLSLVTAEQSSKPFRKFLILSPSVHVCVSMCVHGVHNMAKMCSKPVSETAKCHMIRSTSPVYL